MNFENFSSIPKNKKELYEKAEIEFLEDKIVEMNNGALLEEDFVLFADKNGETYGLYDQKEVEKDKETVDIIKKGFLIKNKKNEISSENYEYQTEVMRTSRFLEALFYEKLGGEKGWLPGARVYKTSEYDDFINGVDFLVEIDNAEFGVAVDVTLSRQASIILNKLKKGKTLIDHNKLVEIKYYEGVEGDKVEVPFSLMALDYDHAVQALKFWAEGEDDLLSRHPTRVKVWLELKEQFESYKIYAEKTQKHEIARSYGKALESIEKIILLNKDIIEKYRDLIEKDQAYNIIIDFCEELKK